ncbi:MAG: GNAT family N-acetyltransferase [Bdellovibrionota bacterium]
MLENDELRIEVKRSIGEFSAQDWNRLAGNNPALSYAYLLAMEQSGCASPKTGWVPQFLGIYSGAELLGAMPLYFKSHSYGEFVFDFAWAEAYERNGLGYYPKLVSAVPFTPITGARLLGATAEIRSLLLRAAIQLARQAEASSLHILFPSEKEAREISASHPGLMLRNTVQFHWRNSGAKTFADFLKSMRHDKRKKIKQERRKLAEGGISFSRVRGENATEEDWKFFYSCYLHTHHIYQSPAPLSLEFFQEIARTMPENILLIFGSRGEDRIAAAFDLYSDTHFYGRWWGALEYIPGLHFEVCYYQAIEFCLENSIQVFEGGAQGEHKLARGLLPVATFSVHWLAHPQFAAAVDDYLLRETGSILQYVNELNLSNPFKES